MEGHKFAVFDIDGTLFRWQLFSEIVFELIATGHIPEQARQDVDKKMAEWRSRKHSHAFHDYEMAIVKVFLSSMKQLSTSAIEKAADTVLERSGTHVYAYTRDLMTRLRGQGYVLIALSGSQNEVVQRFATLWNFDIALGQVHEAKEGLYTGDIPGGKLLVLQKGSLLQALVKQHGLTWEDSIAIGDSKSDAAMLELVQQPIAFNPADDLFDIAKEKGWRIVVERKNMIYELEPRDGVYILAKAGTQ
ncbi:MAG TPA: HAD-IB family hydrolase [Candidatus Saccharimonadales bacterium]|nr:HAD-IB family hydrolase [Candidatus Saccharimonadales bacterium]